MPSKELYVAPQGMSAVAKALAPGLPIERQWLATALTPLPQGWRIEGDCLGQTAPLKPKALKPEL
jgi:predicted NAD/FAD-dependent oxidoreductase